MRRPRIGIALGGGSARGWAHIGVLQFLREMGLRPDVVAGTSIGAIVGGAEVAGELDSLREWVEELSWKDVLSFLDVGTTGGLIAGVRLIDFFREHFRDRDIEALERPYGAVTTDLLSGQEVWLREGSMLQAIRASIALPGLFSPTRIDGRWMVDGGLVNPVPVSLCRALGAERIIAVDLNSDILLRRAQAIRPPEEETEEEEAFDLAEILRRGDWRRLLNVNLPDRAEQWKSMLLGEGEGAPSLVDVIAQSLYIMQVRITRARMAGDPPDVLLMPRLGHIRLMEFHRAREAIAVGYRCAERAREQLETLLEP